MIYGNRIRLRGIERNELPIFVKWLNDPEVLEGLYVYPILSQADEEIWFDEMLKHPIAEHPMVIEIRKAFDSAKAVQKALEAHANPEEWIPIGNCSYMNRDQSSRSSEVGIVIGDKRYWNQGYGTETMRLLLDHGFNNLNLHRIWLRVFATNPRAIRAYEKAGFIQEGRMREALYRNGKYVDILLMSALENERNYALGSSTP